MRIGLLPLGRPTFDVEFANEKLEGMLELLDASGHDILGSRELLFDADQTAAAIDGLKDQSIDRLLLLQVTFTDASMTLEAARAFDVPLSIWATSEPRLGGRLRLNGFCGLNLASHALGLTGKRFSWGYGELSAHELSDLLSGDNEVQPMVSERVQPADQKVGIEIAQSVQGKRIARIGERPVGFDTCDYDPAQMKILAGVSVDALSLDDLFDPAKSVPESDVSSVRDAVEAQIEGLEGVDQDELDKSLRLKVALDQMKDAKGYDAFAIRCWPETFTEYGGAVCGPVSMLGENKVPCACEADVYGSLTQLILQEVAQAPVFLADLVDIDTEDNTGVVWHCGQAPLSMRDDESDAMATIHTNRKMPLLMEFTLKPGRVTFARVSQAQGEQKMIISTGEMVRAPMAFTGTSGVVRFDTQAEDMLKNVMNSGLEHHMALAYGDHREALISVAAALDLPVLEL